MITWLEEAYRSADGTTFRSGVCLSTDAKPTPDDMANGSKLEEMDTGAVYRYNRAGEEWVTPTSETT